MKNVLLLDQKLKYLELPFFFLGGGGRERWLFMTNGPLQSQNRVIMGPLKSQKQFSSINSVSITFVTLMHEIFSKIFKL